MPTVGVPRLLRYHVGDQAEVEVQGNTLGAALRAVFDAHPGLARHVTDERGHFRAHVVLALNGQVLGRDLDLDRSVEPGDEIRLLQAVSGG